MKILDPGHNYLLNVLDSTPEASQRLTFVKRNKPPEKYPGNENSYIGTTIQEVCRALIDRCKYVNNQEHSPHTEVAITHLRSVIRELEVRAARRHNRPKLLTRADIENEPTCKICGHIQCNETCRGAHDDKGTTKEVL